LAKSIHVFAAEKTPLYLPLYIAKYISGLWRTYQIEIHEPTEKGIDGDKWAIAQFAESVLSGKCNDRICFAVCDPTKLADNGTSDRFAIVGALISKAAFWVVGKEAAAVQNANSGPDRVFTYPAGMSAKAIADSIWCADLASGTLAVESVAVDHELCHLLVRSKDSSSGKALTANILAAVRFTKDHHKEHLKILDTLAKNSRFEDYFLTGIIGVRDEVENTREARRFLGHLGEAMRLVSTSPDYAARVMARIFQVSVVEAKDVVERLNAIKIYDRYVPSCPSWRLALQFKYRSEGVEYNDQDLDRKAGELFGKLVLPNIKKVFPDPNGLRWRLWLFYAWAEGRLKDLDLSKQSRGKAVTAILGGFGAILGMVLAAIVAMVIAFVWQGWRAVPRIDHSTAVQGKVSPKGDPISATGGKH